MLTERSADLDLVRRACAEVGQTVARLCPGPSDPLHAAGLAVAQSAELIARAAAEPGATVAKEVLQDALNAIRAASLALRFAVVAADDIVRQPPTETVAGMSFRHTSHAAGLASASGPEHPYETRTNR
ncbi:hypothetical protein GCM10010174_06540 [Kutzneria viridogrisea]|uniref:Uncharacterized protein n=2 Tax=Kutzneria TaxID=43356 RepID=W5WA71_9PSEU|nr:hypothetical protein [Kutzneria albida]AHH97446.1 hypothetical protein KALB_4082 [Kutzneria albida DSM 43870]MBA8930632.1 hypothetical protein [Kutzneria viridogrisea]